MIFENPHLWAEVQGPDFSFSVDSSHNVKITVGWINQEGEFQKSVDGELILSDSAMRELIHFYEYMTTEES